MIDAVPYTFPFGQPVVVAPDIASGARDCLVIAGMPSAVFVCWKPTGASTVQGIAVDNEPRPLWDGHDHEAVLAAWRQKVAWQSGWGTIAPTKANGRDGRWLALHALMPLGIAGERVRAVTLLDRFHASNAVKHRILDHYRSCSERLGLPVCSLPDQPSHGDVVRAALTTQRERLLAVLRDPAIRTVITMGAAPASALLGLLGLPARTDPLGQRDGGMSYGDERLLDIAGRPVSWYACINPASPSAMQKLHAAWELKRGVRTQVGMFK